MTSTLELYHRTPPWVQTVLLNTYALGISAHRYGWAYRRAIRVLAEHERWSPGRLRAYQDQRIREIVEVAYRSTRYYREVMDEAGLRPSDVRGVSDLPCLPLLGKDVVRNRMADMLTAPAPRRGWLKGHTSGTTGSPLDIWYDRDTCILNNAVDQRQKSWGGMRAGDWIGLFLGRVIVPIGTAKPPFWRVNRIHRQVWFSSFHLSDENLAVYVDEIRRRGLRFLEGYPSTMFILARYLVRRGESLPMTAVFTSSETLHALQRETIEAAFGCRIYDFYGLAERVIFATECERHDGKHLAQEYGYTEVVDEEGTPLPPGRPGFLVGTSLHNTAMPMIRYRTSDISRVVTEQCECGRTLVRMVDVATKAEDLVTTPDGRIISPSILTHPFKPFHQLLKSQIVQETPDTLIVKLVRSEEFTSDHETQLVDGLQARLGERMTIRVEYVDDIARESSGKFRWVISKVDAGYRVPWEQVKL